MGDGDDIRSQIEGALKDVSFPLRTPQELTAAMPGGAETKFRAGSFEISVAEAVSLLKPGDFPIDSAKQVADVIAQRAGL